MLLLTGLYLLSSSGIFLFFFFKAVGKNLLLVILLEALMTLKFSTCNRVIVVGKMGLRLGWQSGFNPELPDKALDRDSWTSLDHALLAHSECWGNLT